MPAVRPLPTPQPETPSPGPEGAGTPLAPPSSTPPPSSTRPRSSTRPVALIPPVAPWRALLLNESRRPRRVRDSPLAPGLAVATVCIGALLGQLDASIVTVALPDLRADLGISLATSTWVSLSYLVVLVAMVAPFGRLADAVGRKLLYVHGFAVFTLASLGAALAPNLAVLLACRVAQGLGAAMLQANSVALIATTVPRRLLARSLGAQGAAQAVGLSLGPLVGGLLIQLGGWRWIFYAHLPAGVIGIVLGIVLLPRTRERCAPAPFDWGGLALLAPLVVTVMLTLSLLGGRSGVGAGRLAGLLAGALLVIAASAVLLVRRERRAAAPVIDLGLLRRREVGPGLAAGLLAFLVMFGLLLVIPQTLVATGSMSRLEIGLLLGVLPMGFGVAAPVAGLLVDRAGARTVTVAGLLVPAGGLVLAAVGGSGAVVLVAALALVGLGLGLFTPANNAGVMTVVAAESSGMASGLLNMARGLGTALGVAVAALAYQAGGYRLVMICLAVLAVIGAVLAAARPALPAPPALPARPAPPAPPAGPAPTGGSR